MDQSNIHLYKIELSQCSLSMLPAITTHHYACFDTIRELSGWPLKTDGYLKAEVAFLLMPIYLVLDEIGRKMALRARATLAWTFACLYLGIGIYQGFKPKWNKSI